MLRQISDNHGIVMPWPAEAAEKKKEAQSDEFAKWRVHSSDIRAKYGIPRDSRPWTKRAATKLKGVEQTPRQKDVLDVGFALRLQASPIDTTTAQLVKDYWADVSSSVSRLPFSHGIQSYRQNSCHYSYEKDVVISGAFHMRTLGWPEQVLPRSVSDTMYRRMSGEAFSVPICFMLHWIMWCNPWGPWWQQCD